MKTFIRTGVALALILIIGAGAAVWYGWRSVSHPLDPGASAEDAVRFEIGAGQGLATVTTRLAAEGLVQHPRIVELYGRYRGYAPRLQAGRYIVSPAMSAQDMLEAFVGGDAVFDQIRVTIPEGWSLNDIETYFEETGLFTRERFQEAAVMQERYRRFPLLADLEDDTILDGYLFPDTYLIFPSSTPETIVERMIEALHARITPEMLDAIAEQGRTLHDVLTLASIVQKESAGDAEMPDVAGVFTNRLRINMRLESDATVNYVLGTSKLQPTFADTEVQHPYNTYENYGLPPAPIGNPGLPAIAATIAPSEHEYLFFLHKPSREIVLSRTFRDHLAAKARYLD